jgi:hypothetical protein
VVFNFLLDRLAFLGPTIKGIMKSIELILRLCIDAIGSGFWR